MPKSAMSLIERLRQRRPDAFSGADERAAEELLVAALRASEERWPQIRGAADALLDQLARHLPARLEELRSLSLGDLLLAGACKAGDRAALAEFDRRLSVLVPRCVAGFALASADEVQQQLRQKLFTGDEPRIAGYSGRRPLEAWLRVAALRCAIDQQEAHKPGDDHELEDLCAGPDPELDAMKLLDGEALRAILREVLQGLPSAQRALLKLHYLEGISLEKLAMMDGVHRTTVARRLAETRSEALERLRAILAERLRLSPGDGESLIRFVRSRLDLSLHRALESRPA
jgi:RNA polymerase sigma-70 factor (ECF subfamily)